MTAELVQVGNQVTAMTPDAWQTFMRPVADVSVLEVVGRKFCADMSMFGLSRTVYFNLNLPNTRVLCPGAEFISVNIVTNGVMRTASPSQNEWTPRTIHIVNHLEQEYDFSTDQDLSVLTLCFQKPLLTEYARKFYDADESRFFRAINDNVPESDATECFSRFARFVWDELGRSDAILRSPLATKEIENSLWALFLNTVDQGSHSSRYQRTGGYATYARLAEEFIDGRLANPLHVADIAVAVRVSVPTLNRAFRKCHGMGPSAFVKLRRLERVRTELIRAEPQETTVSHVAANYGFWQLSHFAADYKRAFHERPSETLRRAKS